ncbi:Phosphatidylinositol-4-phosphate 5-kinase, N-terminal domain [Phytophthora cactorum]|nr:Phosphatidylinositol-4-phosphate 5-kinase, N-terminal domain [Phytophthora cactorum]
MAEALTFGSLISATDAVSILAVFQELHVDPTLFYLVFGESSLNDAVAICLFETFSRFIGHSYEFKPMLFAIFEFGLVLAGSTMVGVIFGMIPALLFKHGNLRSNLLHEVGVFVMFAYLPFVVSQVLGMSGVVSIIFAGVSMKHYASPNLTPEARDVCSGLFNTLSHMAETSVFLTFGLTEYYRFWLIFWMATFCLFSRGCAVYPLSYVLNLRKNAAKITLNQQHVIWYGGMRGAVAFALSKSFPGEKRPEIVATTLIVVLLSIIIMGGGTVAVLDKCGIPRLTAEEEAALDKTVKPHRHMRALQFDNKYLIPLLTNLCQYGDNSSPRKGGFGHASNVDTADEHDSAEADDDEVVDVIRREDAAPNGFGGRGGLRGAGAAALPRLDTRALLRPQWQHVPRADARRASRFRPRRPPQWLPGGARARGGCAALLRLDMEPRLDADSDYTQCDEEGWTYGSSIERINCRLAEGTSKVKRGYYHFLRRRRWIRTRVRTPLSAVQGETEQSRLCTAPSPTYVRESRLSETQGPNRYYRVYRDSLKAYFQLGSAKRSSNFVRVDFTDDDIQKEGWLGVRGTLSRSWKLRYFLLRWDSSSLVCLRDRASMIQVSEELIDRHTTLLVEESSRPRQFQFSVCNGERTLRLNAVDGTSRASWISALSEMIVRSRASFFAADESESGSSTRSRSFRRMRSSTEEDGSIVSASMVNEMNGESNGAKQKHSRGAWRPYKFISSTMQSKRKTDEICRRDYVKQFTETLDSKIQLATAYISENIAILEENLCTAQEFLPSVPCVPVKEIQRLRVEVDSSIAAFRVGAKVTLRSDRTSVLGCNVLLKELLRESVISLAPSQEHATIKKIVCESPTKRRIPLDWFTEGAPLEKDREQPSLSDESALSTSTSNSTVGKLELSYTSGSSLEIKRPNSLIVARHDKRSSSVPESNRSTSTPVSYSSHSLHASDAIRIKPYTEIPAGLREGHFDLPNGVNGYVVKVHDKDIGSLIGYTLCSAAYIDQLEAHFEKQVNIAEELHASENMGISEVSAPSPPKSEEAPEISTASTDDASPSSNATTATNSVTVSDKKQVIYLSKLRSKDLQHTSMKFSYAVGSTNHEVRCVAYFAAQFHALRALTVPGNVEFLNSIIESKRWDTSGGKSGAFFSMTHDKRYVLKGISVVEFNMFVHMAPKYFNFISRVVEVPTPTVITKIVGLFKLSHSRRLLKHTEYVVIMENFSYGFPPGQMYDLKGILRRRYNGSSSDEEDRHESFNNVSNVQVSMNLPVLLDGNFSERMPVPVAQPELDIIEAAIQNDTGFLYRAGVIDYSLLLRFDEDKRQVIVGLIDYLHQFDFLKKMESTSKASLTFRNPTVISPISYRRRFMNAMNRYFVGIEKELEIRMRKRCGFKSKPGMRPSVLTASPSASTTTDKPKARIDEERHADVAARLADNMSLTSESPLLSERPPAKSEYRLPRQESDWTSSKPRGHSMSHLSDHEVQCDRVTHSEGECNSSPCSSSSASVKSYPATPLHNNNVILEERSS